MKNMRTAMILVSLILSVSCSGQKQKENIPNNALIVSDSSSDKKKKDNIPKNAFPIVYRNHIYIKGEAEGVKGNFVFDTGALGFYYDSTYFANNSFPYTNFFTAYLSGAGNSAQKVEVIKDTINLIFDNNVYRTNDVPIIQLKPIIGDFADGILGMEYFYQSVMEINSENGYMRLFQSIDSVDVSAYCRIELIKKDNRLLIPLKIRVNETLTIAGVCMLDFGKGSSLSITSSAANKYRLHENIAKKTLYYTKYGGVGGESSHYEFMSASVQIGDFVLNNVTMEYSLNKRGALASDKYLGVLGNDIYERFNVLIDFLNNDFYIKPNSKYEEPFEFSKLGFTYADRSQTMNAWIVKGLYRGANAENQGLKIDDRIVEVNGKSVNQINYESQKGFFNKLSNVVLTIKRNDVKKDIKINLEPIQ